MRMFAPISWCLPFTFASKSWCMHSGTRSVAYYCHLLRNRRVLVVFSELIRRQRGHTLLGFEVTIAYLWKTEFLWSTAVGGISYTSVYSNHRMSENETLVCFIMASFVSLDKFTRIFALFFFSSKFVSWFVSLKLTS